MSIAQMVACQRRLQPNWFPEDQPINLRSVGTETGFVAARTRLDDPEFKKAFYMAVSIVLFHECADNPCRSLPLDPTFSCMRSLQPGSSLFIILKHPLRGVECLVHLCRTRLAYQRAMLKNSSLGTADMDSRYYTSTKLLEELGLGYVVQFYDSVNLNATLHYRSSGLRTKTFATSSLTSLGTPNPPHASLCRSTGRMVMRPGCGLRPLPITHFWQH